MAVDVSPMQPADLPALNLQLAQRLFMGWNDQALTAEYAAGLIACGPAWTVRRADGSVLAACGFAEQHPQYAVCWALLAEGLGHDHLALSREVRARIDAADYRRIEALVRADHREGARWARLMGFDEVFLVRAAGPFGEDFRLFERVKHG